MRTLILLITLALSGCATVKVSELSTVDSRIGTVPAIGEQAVAPVGGIIFSQFRYWSKTGYRLKGDLSVGLGLGRVSVSDGDFVLKAEVETKLQFALKSVLISTLWLAHIRQRVS